MTVTNPDWRGLGVDIRIAQGALNDSQSNIEARELHWYNVVIGSDGRIYPFDFTKGNFDAYTARALQQKDMLRLDQPQSIILPLPITASATPAATPTPGATLTPETQPPAQSPAAATPGPISSPTADSATPADTAELTVTLPAPSVTPQLTATLPSLEEIATQVIETPAATPTPDDNGDKSSFIDSIRDNLGTIIPMIIGAAAMSVIYLSYRIIRNAAAGKSTNYELRKWITCVLNDKGGTHHDKYSLMQIETLLEHTDLSVRALVGSVTDQGLYIEAQLYPQVYAHFEKPKAGNAQPVFVDPAAIGHGQMAYLQPDRPVKSKAAQAAAIVQPQYALLFELADSIAATMAGKYGLSIKILESQGSAIEASGRGISINPKHPTLESIAQSYAGGHFPNKARIDLAKKIANALSEYMPLVEKFGPSADRGSIKATLLNVYLNSQL